MPSKYVTTSIVRYDEDMPRVRHNERGSVIYDYLVVYVLWNDIGHHLDSDFSLMLLLAFPLYFHINCLCLFSVEEAGRYLETYKSFEKKPPDLIMEKTEANFLAQVG